jgi:hypothetical protein
VSSCVASRASSCWAANCRDICDVPSAWARRLSITVSKKYSSCWAPSRWAAAVPSEVVLYAATRAPESRPRLLHGAAAPPREGPAPRLLLHSLHPRPRPLGVRQVPRLEALRRVGPAQAAGCRVAPTGEADPRVRRPAPLLLRRRALVGDRQARGGRGREAVRNRVRTAAAQALRPGGGRLAYRLEARRVRAGAPSRPGGLAGGAVPLSGRPLARNGGSRPAQPVSRSSISSSVLAPKPSAS